MCVLYDYRYGIFLCKCVSVSECKLCYIIYVVVQRAKRKTAVAILAPQFSYFNFHMNFSCKLTVYIYIYICFLCMKIENKLYSILFYSGADDTGDDEAEGYIAYPRQFGDRLLPSNGNSLANFVS